MRRIAVVYYSRTGNTKKMAEAVVLGARQKQGVEVSLFEVKDFPVEKALEYDALVVGSPTYYGHMSCEIKEFFDKSVKFHGKLSGKVGGAFSSAANVGGGNETTVLGILQAMLIHGMIVRGDHKGDHYGPVAIGDPDERAEKECVKLGRNISELLEKIKNN